MASDIHKKLVFGALGCGGLLVVFAVIGFLVERGGLVPDRAPPEIFTPDESALGWDSLSATSAARSLTTPEEPTWSAHALAARAFVYVTPRRAADELYPLLGDTFPAGSPERKKWELLAQRVGVREVVRSPVPEAAPAPFYKARIFLAAADDWSRHGDIPGAELALDSALGLARGLLRSYQFERVWQGARIERDALELLSRDTLLAGSPADAAKAGQAMIPFARMAGQLRAVDHWMISAGASPTYIDSLAVIVGNDSLPVVWRAHAASAIGLGWVFSPLEPTMGISPARRAALLRVQATKLPPDLAEVIDGATPGTWGLTERLRIAANIRGQRWLLAQP